MLCGGLLVAFLSGKGAGRKAEKLDKLDETLKSVKKDLKAKEKSKNGAKKTLQSKKKALEEIKKSKPTISDGSLKIYSGNIFRLYKNIVKSDDAKFKTDFLKNFEAVKNFIYTKKSLQTKKQYFATVVVVAQALKLSPAIINKYRAEMIKVKEEQDETTQLVKERKVKYESLFN